MSEALQRPRTVVPAATIRRQVTVPLRFPDGYATTAKVLTFDGLVDDQEHLALGLGDWQRALRRGAAGGRLSLGRPQRGGVGGGGFGSQRGESGPRQGGAGPPIAHGGG